MDTSKLEELLDGVTIKRTPKLDAAFQKFLDNNLEKTEFVSVDPYHFIEWRGSNTNERFEDYLFSTDIIQNINYYIYQECYSALQKISWDNDITKDTFEEILDNFQNMQCITYKYEYPKVRLDLILATKEEVSNELRTIFHIINNGGEPENNTNALSWLIKTQGYTLDQILHGEYPKDSFPESLKNELNEDPGTFPTVTALCSMNLDELVKAIEEKSTIILPKEATIGLFDPMTGAGSLLSVTLEKDISIPSSIIFDTIIENKHGSESLYSKYSVDDVYGLVYSAWDTQAQTTDQQTVYIKPEMPGNNTEMSM